jgi:hypothetical protein
MAAKPVAASSGLIERPHSRSRATIEAKFMKTLTPDF